jgi:pilus assembly protein Flp/PilA
MTSLSKRFWADESGGTAIEYGLLAAFLGLGLVFSLTTFKEAFATLVDRIAAALSE